MSWVAVGAAAISAGGAILSSKSSSKASKQATEASEAELAFAKKQYADWKKVYGPIEKNLARYYKQITPAMIETRALEAFELEKDTALTTARENLAQRGIATSGIAGATEIAFETMGAQERARIRADAPMKAAQEKSKFLQIGLGQDPAGDVLNTLGARSDVATRIAEQRRGETAEAISGAVTDVIGLIKEKPWKDT